MKKHKALGSGLSDLFGDIDAVYDKAYENKQKQIYEIDIDLIKPNPMQPRLKFDEDSIKELANSIKEHGLLQPIIIREDIDNKYILIAGERRLRATKILNQDKIKAIIIDTKEHKMRELALIENIQRENLNPIELALCYKALLKEHNLTQEQLSQKIQKSRTQIANTIRLLDLSNEAKNLINEGKLTQGHAKMLIGLNPNDENIALQTIIGQKLNVRDTESLAKKLKSKKNLKKENESLEVLLELQQILKQYNIKSNIKDKNITLTFDDESLVNNLINKLK